MSAPVADRMHWLGRFVRDAAWAPLVVLVAHAVAGALWGHEPYVDPVMHLSGGIAAAFFFQRTAAMSSRWLGVLTPLGLGLLAFGLTSSMAILWEFGEFLSDQLRGTRIQVDIENTMRDLVLGMAGAGVFVVASWTVASRRASRA